MSRTPTFVHARRDNGPVEIDLEGVPEGGARVNLDNSDPNAIEIVEIDDTPEKDKGRPTVVDDPLEVTEEELRSYGQRAQERIKRLGFETNTERRGREAAERTATEATALARRLMAENETLKRTSTTVTAALTTSMLKSREDALTVARNALAAAHNEGDGEAIANATAEISALTSEITMIKAQTPKQPTEPEGGTERQPTQPAQRQQAPQMEPNVAAWVSANRTWFGRPGFEEKTAVAYSIHNKLIDRGVSPSSDAYTDELDKGLKTLFQDHKSFRSTEPNTTEREREPSRRADVVGSGSRQVADPPGQGRTVVLTASQLKLAKTLGITPQAYAASFAASQQKDSAR